ncbi:MAG: hypothetical protein ACE5HO_18220 [bacterium]
MYSYKKWFVTAVTASWLIAQLGCSDNPASSQATSGSVKISVKGINTGSAASVSKINALTTTITSARLVIKKIKFESTLGDSADFKFRQPFVQDLVVGSKLHEIETVQVPFGSYKESKIKVDGLKAEDGAVFTQNPELQNLSVMVQGFLNGDQNESFVFTSELDEEQEREFATPLVLDQNNPATNIVLTIDMDSWFVDKNGAALDPRMESNRSKIEENIKNSIDVFEDENDDGEKDDDN